jgi:hypothetical protein
MNIALNSQGEPECLLFSLKSVTIRSMFQNAKYQIMQKIAISYMMGVTRGHVL